MTRISFAVRRDELKRIEFTDQCKVCMRKKKQVSVLAKPLKHN